MFKSWIYMRPSRETQLLSRAENLSINKNYREDKKKKPKTGKKTSEFRSEKWRGKKGFKKERMADDNERFSRSSIGKIKYSCISQNNISSS